MGSGQSCRRGRENWCQESDISTWKSKNYFKYWPFWGLKCCFSFKVILESWLLSDLRFGLFFSSDRCTNLKIRYLQSNFDIVLTSEGPFYLAWGWKVVFWTFLKLPMSTVLKIHLLLKNILLITSDKKAVDNLFCLISTTYYHTEKKNKGGKILLPVTH